jgi:hypothetical protein
VRTERRQLGRAAGHPRPTGDRRERSRRESTESPPTPTAARSMTNGSPWPGSRPATCGCPAAPTPCGPPAWPGRRCQSRSAGSLTRPAATRARRRCWTERPSSRRSWPPPTYSPKARSRRRTSGTCRARGAVGRRLRRHARCRQHRPHHGAPAVADKGQIAARLLLQALDNAAAPASRVEPPTRLILRDSTVRCTAEPGSHPTSNSSPPEHTSPATREPSPLT